MSVTWDDVKKLYDAAFDFRLDARANIKHLDENTIIDENESVVWNRLYVEDNNRKYLEEIKRIQSEHANMMCKAHRAAAEYVKSCVYKDITDDQAMRIYMYAYDLGHSCGLHEVKSYLDELIELINYVICSEDELTLEEVLDAD